jgi:hypothetical protein
VGPSTGGIESVRTWSDCQEHTSPIGFVSGAQSAAPKTIGPMDITKSNYGGFAQMSSGKLTIGGYAGVETRALRAFGVGGYLTLGWGGCQ